MVQLFKKMKLKDNPKYYKKIVNLKTLKKYSKKAKKREGYSLPRKF